MPSDMDHANMEYAGQVLEGWQRLARHWRARRDRGKLRKRGRKAIHQVLLGEFSDAWGRTCQQACLLRESSAGRPFGLKQRRFYVPLASQPTKSDWLQRSPRPGFEGGGGMLNRSSGS
eukprot:3864290-Alexandrium_andersonii.AAC.2